MKKIVLGAAFLCASMASAQFIDFSQTRFGVTAGGNYSRVRNAHNPSGPRYTFQAGVLALIPISNDDMFYIQPELVYYGAGETGKDKAAVGRPGYDAIYANNYISMPIYFKAYFSEAENEFFGMIGPRFSYLMNQKVTNAPGIYTIEQKGKAAPFNFAIGAGVGYSYKRQLELALRYDFGVNDTYPDMKQSITGAKTEQGKSQQVLSATLSYIFE